MRSIFRYIPEALKNLLKQCRDPELRVDHSSIESLERNLKQLDTDWTVLWLFYCTYNCRWRDGCDFKIEDAAQEIGEGLMYVVRRDYLSRKTSELINRIDKYQTMTDTLESEIGKALNSFDVGTSASTSRDFDTAALILLKVYKRMNKDDANVDPSFKEEVSALYKMVELIERFSNCYFDISDDPVILAFRDHVESVVLRIAYESCNFWFNRKADPTGARIVLSRLVDLDPFNPKFLELNINFLKAVHRFGFINSSMHLDDDFFRSLLTWKGDYDFKKEMMILATIVIAKDLDMSREDVQTFFFEIGAVLMEAASLFKPSRQGNETVPPLLSELGTHICLLKAEHLLKYYQLNSCSFSVLFGKHSIKELNMILKQLRKFSNDLPQEKTEYSKLTLPLIQDVYNEVTSLRQLQLADECSISMFKISFLQLLLKIVIFKAEFFLMEFLKSDASVMAYEKVQAESLLEQLQVFNLILRNKVKEDTEEAEIIFPQIEVFARRITVFSYSFLPNKNTEEMIEKPVLPFSELLDKAQHIKAKLKEISPPFPVSALPMANGLGFIDFLSRNLGELLKYSPKSIAPVKNHIEEVQVHMKSFLMKVSDSDLENPGLKNLCDCMINVAYKVDYVIDSIEVDAHWQHFFWFYNLLEELRLVVKQASDIQVTTSNAKVQTASNVAQVSHNRISWDRTPAISDVVVDLVDAEKYIINRLTRGSSQRDIVSIVGMPGIGKTTLATKVYNSQQIKSHFHRLAWCTVSQVYDKRRLLLEILNSTQGVSGEIRKMSTEELELTLHQCLLRNKYLIVMDDLWSAGAWDDLKNSFPDNCCGRILLTSRQRSVALEIKPDSDPYSLCPFSVEESWELLEKKVFKGECCPEQLLIVGKEIARRCQGLPLAVVAIAGLLGRTEKSQSWWTRVAESLNSQIINDAETRCMEIFELSYKYLPKHLKACFLYLGVFLENNHIPVSKVMQFWLAEGFIKTESKSLEEVAEEYLMDLIDRSLVIISKIRSNGKVKECRLHDLLHDFCRSKAKEEKFFQLVTRFDEPYASFPGPDHDAEFDDDHRLDSVAFESYRLGITLKRSHFINSRPFGPSTRSLIFFASTDSEPRCPYEISFISDNFKTLRVLDLECINMGTSFPNEIGLLVQLRFLAVSGFVQSIPESIGNLWKLEILLVQGLRGGKVFLPYTIWRMTRLRHLHVTKYVAFSLHEEEAGCSFQLDNLVSFSFLTLTYGEGTEKILVRFRNLRKLKCIFKESRDSSENCNKFPALNLLTHLESLNIVYPRGALNPREFILPSSLKQLTLSNCRLPWDHISTIGKLPSLEVLKLVSGAFEGQKWDMREEEFQELKFLKLDALDIAQWNATSDHLPKLQRLVLQNCKALQKVPDDFEYITSLEIIEVHWCGQSAEESAREIGKDIKVVISHSQFK